MRSASFFLVPALGAAVSAIAAGPFRMLLKDDQPGSLPKGWVAAKTGQGPGSVWKVVEDATTASGKALAQTSADGRETTPG